MNTPIKKSHYFVLSSYLIIGLLMIVASLFSSHLERELQFAKQQLDQTVKLKSQVENLYQHARNRSVILFRLVNSRDLFDIDELNLKLSAEASAMILLAENIQGHTQTETTKRLINNLLDEFRFNYQKQAQVVKLVLEGEHELASSLLVFDTLPAQEGALAMFRQLQAYYDIQFQQQNAHISDTISLIKKYWSIGLAAFLILLLIAGKATYDRLRKTDEIQQSFQQQLTEKVNQRTQELVLDSGILHNINEAVVIADQQGLVIKTNPPYDQLINALEKLENNTIWQQLEQLFYGFNALKTQQLMTQQNLIRQEVLLKSNEEQHYLVDIFVIENSQLNQQYLGFLLTDISHFKATQNELEALANYDNVTSLANRHLFQNTLQSWIKDNKNFTVFFIDLDNFKWINDTQGHEEGDRVLEQVAQLLTRLLPDSANNLVARLGGDEFSILYRETDELKIANLANEMITGVKQLYQVINPSKTLGCSIGIAHYPKDGTNREDLMRHADYAMYKAKEQGKNRYCLFSDEMNEQIHYLYDSEIKLHRALEKQEFYLVYQLQYRLDTLSVSGAEALIRWESAGHFISPAEFIPLAEKFGLIQSIGRYVLQAALAQLATWNHQAHPLPRIAINVSTAQLNGDGFVDAVEQALTDYQINPNQLELEITEGLLMDHLSEDNKALHKLQQRGLEIAIDDFGTGYSSLAYIKHLNVDRIKIDQSFVRDLDYNAESYSIVKTIISMGHSLGLKVIAEGIETLEQLAILRELGCDEGQGYLLARPLKPHDLSFDALKPSQLNL